MTSAGTIPSSAAVLRAEDARIAVDDVIATSGLSYETKGDRVLCLGEVGPLLAVLSGVPLGARGSEATGPVGEARVVSGRLSVAGRDVAAGAHFPILGAAPLDPPLPPAWTVEEYVLWSARLTGAGARLAGELVSAALARAGLAAARRRSLRALLLPERRALLLAHAVVAEPAVVVAEAPLSGLDGAGAAFVMAALARILEGRAAIVSASRLDPATAEGAFARGASDVLFLSRGELALAGPAAEVLSGARLYGLTVRTHADALRVELAARGIELSGGPLRFAIALPPDRGPSDVLAAAASARAAVVELLPLLP